MWTRVQLKDKAKYALDRNYWKIFLVSLIIMLVGGGTATQTTNTFEDEFDYSTQYEDLNALDVYGDGFEDGISGEVLEGFSVGFAIGILIMFFIVLIIVVAVACAIALAYGAFIRNPVDVGAKRFFFRTLNEKADVKEVAFAYDNNYKNVAKILFVRDLKVLLWSLLFLIPGIVKSYEYFMMPYLLAENPNLTKDEAFRLSKQMMTGNKWKTFVLELSFFWWDVLSVLTVGLIGLFFVNPYKNLTFAALYEELSVINGRPARAAALQEELEWNIPS